MISETTVQNFLLHRHFPEKMKISAFGDLKLCSILDRYQRFGRAFHLHLLTTASVEARSYEMSLLIFQLYLLYSFTLYEVIIFIFTILSTSIFTVEITL